MKQASCLIALFLVLLTGCSGGPKVGNHSAYSFSEGSNVNNITADGNETYKSANYLFADGDENISIIVSQTGYKALNESEKIVSSKAEFRFIVKFRVDVINNSSKYTFDGFNMGNWFLYDSNEKIWSLIDTDNGKKPNELGNCGPGSEKSYELTYASGDYLEIGTLPDKLIMKIVGGFSPDIFRKKFNEELIFERK